MYYIEPLIWIHTILMMEDSHFQYLRRVLWCIHNVTHNIRWLASKKCRRMCAGASAPRRGGAGMSLASRGGSAARHSCLAKTSFLQVPVAITAFSGISVIPRPTKHVESDLPRHAESIRRRRGRLGRGAARPHTIEPVADATCSLSTTYLTFRNVSPRVI